jgi:hypothetical protein
MARLWRLKRSDREPAPARYLKIVKTSVAFARRVFPTIQMSGSRLLIAIEVLELSH